MNRNHTSSVVPLAVCVAALIYGGPCSASASAAYPELCSAPPPPPHSERRAAVASLEAPPSPVSTTLLNDSIVMLEYESVYDVHSEPDQDSTLPFRSQRGWFDTSTILGHLTQIVDPRLYDFVLLYTIQEVPGWIHSGDFGRVSAKNIGIPHGLYEFGAYFPDWPRLRGVPHMNSADFIDRSAGSVPRTGALTALHEIGHHWSVFWGIGNPLLNLSAWKTTDPIAWLASGGGHWSYLWIPDDAAGIMYSGPLSPRYTDFDLYAMGLMPYEEARRTTYRVHEDNPTATQHPLRVEDLVFALSLEGPDRFEQPGRRVPGTDKSALNMNALVVVVSGAGEELSPQQQELLSWLVAELPGAWTTATGGRSVMSVGFRSFELISNGSMEADFDRSKVPAAWVRKGNRRDRRICDADATNPVARSHECGFRFKGSDRAGGDKLRQTIPHVGAAGDLLDLGLFARAKTLRTDAAKVVVTLRDSASGESEKVSLPLPAGTYPYTEFRRVHAVGSVNPLLLAYDSVVLTIRAAGSGSKLFVDDVSLLVTSR